MIPHDSKQAQKNKTQIEDKKERQEQINKGIVVNEKGTQSGMMRLLREKRKDVADPMGLV